MTPDDDARAAKIQELSEAADRAEAVFDAAAERHEVNEEDVGEDELNLLQEAAEDADQEFKDFVWEGTD